MESFHQVLLDWGRHRSLSQQQDVADFLCLTDDSGFFSAEWMLFWAIMADQTLQQDHDKKGTCFALLMFPISSERDDTSLQALINDWHDAEGHSRTLLGCSPGTCIHLDRLNGTNTGKLFTHVHVDGSVKWCAFTIAAVPYHGRITVGRTLAHDCGAGGPMVSLDEL